MPFFARFKPPPLTRRKFNCLRENRFEENQSFYCDHRNYIRFFCHPFHGCICSNGMRGRIMVRGKLQDCFRGTYEFWQFYCRPPLTCLRHASKGDQPPQRPQRRRSHQRSRTFHSRARAGSLPCCSAGYRHGFLRHGEGLLRHRRLKVTDGFVGNDPGVLA